jgi:ABC-type antimicrobial peptide transport system permease subunit
MLLVEDVKRLIRSVDSDQPIANVRTMDDILDGDISNRRNQTTLLSAFSSLALVLASIGIYGVLSYTVAQRTPEIGLRMALGARRADLISGIVIQALRLAVFGVALGLAAAFALTRTFSRLLFDVSPSDATTFTIVAMALLAVATVAALIPARRAATINPILALRNS